MKTTLTTRLVFVTALVVLATADINAYVDPGIGSYLFQALIAGGLVGLLYVKRVFRWIKHTARTILGAKNLTDD